MKLLKTVPVLLLALMSFLAIGEGQQQFTRERWMEEGQDRRGNLVESLLEEYNHLEGMTRLEVEELLGPDQEGEQCAEDGATGRRIPMLVYPVGGSTATGGPEYLYVYLEGDVVTGARLESD